MSNQCQLSIHDDRSPMQFVIPGLTRNPVFSGFPLESTPMKIGAGLTPPVTNNAVAYKRSKISTSFEL
jgi:hypothetical protein